MLIEPMRRVESLRPTLRLILRQSSNSSGCGHNSARPARTFQRTRAFSRAAGLQDGKYSRYFWPARPDFLPSRSADDKRKGKEHIPTMDSAAMYLDRAARRFLPSPGCRIALPSRSELANSNIPLYDGLVEELLQENLWPYFQAHVKRMKGKGVEVQPVLDISVFDALFWSLASADLVDLHQHEIILGRLRQLYDYAVNQADYRLSRLQLNRMAYIWVTLWEQLDARRMHFSHADFLSTIELHFSEFHGRVASRILGRLTSICNTSQKAGVVLRFLIRYKVKHIEEKRVESWSSSSKTSTYDEGFYFDGKSSAHFDARSLTALLDRCTFLPPSDEVLQLLLALMTHADIGIPSESILRCLSRFHYKSLLAFLPEEVLQDMDFVDLDPRQIHEQSVSCQKSSLIVTRASREELPVPLLELLAAALAHHGDYRLAFHLFQQQRQQQEEQSDGAILAYTNAIRVCALSARESQQNEWAERHLERAMQLFARCKWYECSHKSTAISELVLALDKCFGKEESMDMSEERSSTWLRRLRRFTTILLAHDHALNSIYMKHHKVSRLVLLLRMHLRLRDYPFAKRLFLVESMSENRRVLLDPVLSKSAFLWFFQASLTQETDVAFAEQLFVYWIMLKESAEADAYLPHMPPSLLHMYFGRLFASGKKKGIEELQRYISFDRRTGQRQLTGRTHAVRMIRICFHAGEEYISVALSISHTIIKEWQAKRPNEIETLLTLYRVCLEKAAVGPSSTPTSLQRQILHVFADFRRFFSTWDQDEVDDFFRSSSSSSSSSSLSSSERMGCVYTVYRSALETMVQQAKDIQSMRSAAVVEECVAEMQSKWGLEIGPDIWNVRMEAGLALPDSREGQQHAREMFERGINHLQEQREKEGEGSEGRLVLSSITVGKLMMCLIELGEFHEALQVYYQYKAHALTSPLTNQVMVEAAKISLLHSQGKEQEAIEQVHELAMQTGTEGGYPKKAKWARILRAYSKQLKEQQQVAKEEEEERRRRQEAVDGDGDEGAVSEEDRQRTRAFRAMASGQPWRWRKPD